MEDIDFYNKTIEEISSCNLELLTGTEIIELNKKCEKIQTRAILNDNLEESLDFLVRIEKKIIDEELDDLLLKEQYIINLMCLARIKVDQGKNDEAAELYWEVLNKDRDENLSDKNVIIARLIDLGKDVTSVLEEVSKEKNDHRYSEILEAYKNNSFHKVKEILLHICEENIEKLEKTL